MNMEILGRWFRLYFCLRPVPSLNWCPKLKPIESLNNGFPCFTKFGRKLLKCLCFVWSLTHFKILTNGSLLLLSLFCHFCPLFGSFLFVQLLLCTLHLTKAEIPPSLSFLESLTCVNWSQLGVEVQKTVNGQELWMMEPRIF